MKQKRALFISGTVQNCRQLTAVAKHLPDFDIWYTYYYGDFGIEVLKALRLTEMSIGGRKRSQICLEWLRDHGLPIDPKGRTGGYDLVLTISDILIPKNTRDSAVVALQEGIMDPPTPLLRALQRVPWLPRWVSGTAATSMSGLYDRYCVASEGYIDEFAALGAPRERLVVTGIPYFDDCAQYLDNDFPHKNYVLVCTSDARETLKRDDRAAFIRKAVEIAAGRKLIFKLHPNENLERATQEINRWAPEALVYTSGSAEEMVANCDVYIGQYSTLVFVAEALGKEIHSYQDPAHIKRLLPVQNKCAAARIADVCREALAERAARLSAQAEASRSSASARSIRLHPETTR